MKRKLVLKSQPKKRRAIKLADLPLNEEVFLQPWFLPKDVYFAIRRLLPSIHLAKMRYYFDDYGCLRCGTKEGMYGSNGLCERCTVLVRYRIMHALERRLKQVGVRSEPPPSILGLDSYHDAKRILRDVRVR